MLRPPWNYVLIGTVMSVVIVVLLVVLAGSSDDQDATTNTTAATTTTTTVATPGAAPTTTAPAINIIAPPVPTTAAPPSAAPPTATTAPATVTPVVFPSPAQWAAFRECQTGGDYTAVSPGGTNYGAYQFRVSTWDTLAMERYPSLVGVLPSEASRADQDRMGFALWEEFGTDRWPDCGSELISDAVGPTPTTTTTTPPPTTTTTAPPTTTTTTAPPTATTTTTAPPPTTATTTAPPPTTTTTTTTTSTPPSTGNVPTAEQWDALRECESNNDYTVVSSNGLYYGAYQFLPSTWRDIANQHAPEVADTLPSEASPQIQDFLAQKLYDQFGWRPWPVCGFRHLR